MKKTFFISIYLWAFGFSVLLWVHMRLEGTRTDLAVATMSLGLLTIWGGLFAFLQWRTMVRIGSSGRHMRVPVLLSFVMMVGLALLAEAVSVSMTNTAPLWELDTDEAFITASADWWVVVSRHSVIVFLPQLLLIAWLHRRLSLNPFHWFIVYGMIGYANEWLAFKQAASWFSLPYWLIVYGWVVYLPTTLADSQRTNREYRFHHMILAFLTIFTVSIPWAMFILGI